jgi:hypothetical protein
LLGTQTCNNGAWGTCSGDPGYQTYCPDADLDGYCVLGSCNVSKCPNDAQVTSGHLKTQGMCQSLTDCNDALGTAHPGANELCGDGINENCDAGNLDSDGFSYMGTAVGGLCNNGQLGSCFKTGAVVCGAVGTTTPATCNAGDWADKASWSNVYVTTAQHGSFDTSCNGKLDIKTNASLGPLVAATVTGTCSTVGNAYASTCNSFYAASGNSTEFGLTNVCNRTVFNATTMSASPNMIANYLLQSWIPTCGAVQDYIQCACLSGAGSCSSTSATYVQSCNLRKPPGRGHGRSMC